MTASLGLLVLSAFAAEALESGSGAPIPQGGLSSALAPGILPNLNTIPLPARRPPSMPGSEPLPPPAAGSLPSVPVQSWSQAEIAGAQRRCREIVARSKAIVRELPSLREGTCGTPVPVELATFGSNPQVTVFPPATVNCEMIEALDIWFKIRLQPLARRSLGSPIVQLRAMSSYSCRHAYGSSSRGLSEHAHANAVDIAGFVLSNGEQLNVESGWGPIARVVRWRQQQAAREAVKPAGDVAIKAAPVGPSPLATNPLPLAVPATGLRASTAVKELTPPAPNRGLAAYQAATAALPVLMPPLDTTARFLREAHDSACGLFSTILGPEANDYHKNHFHVDLADRKSGAFCQ